MRSFEHESYNQGSIFWENKVSKSEISTVVDIKENLN